MKNIYPKIFLFLFSFILQLYFPAVIHAQCLCALGVPATPIKQVVAITPTTASSLTFTFQQFNPATGTLSCVKLEDTISAVSTTGARNTGPIANSFLFSLALSSKLSGPSINMVQTFNQVYGYDSLKAYGAAGDSITYGPNNIITNSIGSANGPGNGAYSGNGTVNFTFDVNGGMITLDGGANYAAQVHTVMGGRLGLTYYWCPSALLASGLQNFSARKSDKNIVLKWEAQNAADISQYEIEYSIDGKEFTSVARLAADHSNSASTYNYNYMLNGAGSGYVYFRIKQTGDNGKTGYSAVQKVSLNEKTNTGISILPNPATTGMSINFDRPLSGDYSVDLVNLAGQVVTNKKMKLINSNSIPVTWTNKPAPGIYFTRITNTGSMEQQIVRMVIR